MFSDLSGQSMCISKRIMWIISKSHREIFFCIFLQSPHQVDMKNVVKCYKDYSNTLESQCIFTICLLKDLQLTLWFLLNFSAKKFINIFDKLFILLTMVRNIWVFSPLVPSDWEKNILVLLGAGFAQFVYFLREVGLLFNFWMIKFKK